MELAMDLKEFTAYAPLERRVVREEAVTELALSDYCADAGRIVSWHTQPYITEKRLTESGFEVLGCVKVTALYAGMDGGGLRSCPISVPFAVRQETKEEIAFLEAEAFCESCECRLVNARKIYCRCTVSLGAIPYEKQNIRLCAGVDEGGEFGVQQLKEELSAVYTAETAEKEFRFTDSLPAETERSLEEILTERITPRVQEAVMAGKKLAVKGEICFCALCRTEDGDCVSVRGEMPFAQLLELSPEEESDSFDVSAEVRDRRVFLTVSGGQQHIEAEMTLHLTAMRKKTLRCRCVTDLYATACPVEVQRETALLAQSDWSCVKKESVSVLSETPLRPQKLIWSDVSCGAVQPEKEGSVSYLTVPVVFKAVYLDETGGPAAVQSTQSCRLRFECGPQSRLLCGGARGQETASALRGEGIELHAEVEFPFRLREMKRFTPVVAALADENRPRDLTHAPSVAVRRMAKGDTLWQLAKAHGTTVEAIEKANGSAEEGEFLLIPKIRT